MIRTPRLVAAAALALVSTAGAAHADPYTGPIVGTTTGCFYLTGNPGACSASSTASLGGLQFTGATDANLGSIVNGGGTIVLGTFHLSAHPGNSNALFDNRSFSLFAAFTQPGGDETFVASLDGFLLSPYIMGFQTGFVNVEQSNAGPRTVTYSGASGYGSFLLDIDDSELLTINIDNHATIRATISQATFTAVAPTVTPEPATVALLGTGLLGIGAFGLRRRRVEA